MGPPSLEIPYDGSEARETFSRSQSKWQASLRWAKSTRQFPEESFNLQGILYRTPSLPDTIPSDTTYLEGYSTWLNLDPSCSLGKTGKRRQFFLRRNYPIKCTVSSSRDFSTWPDTPNNGIALLTAGWAYVLTAELAERQSLKMEYCWSHDRLSDDRRPALHLDYALAQERAWWRAIVTRGRGWSITEAPDETVSPWAVEVEDLGVDVAGEVDTSQPPPTARQAACYVARLCRTFGLGNQCSAALAAALTFPLQGSFAGRRSATVELPKPLLTHRSGGSDGGPEIPAEFFHIGHYMSLSLCPSILGPLLWSVFWEPGVPCHCAGAWLIPAATVLKPIIESKNLERLARVLSVTHVAPLWLGLALCGPRGLIQSVLSSLTKLAQYPHTEPDMDSAAWTGRGQSFLHLNPVGPYLRPDGTVSRADVWRLRHDCHGDYEMVTFEHPPSYGWPPFGSMREKDVELEIRPHLRCSHKWAYSHWTWLPDNVTGTELPTTCTISPRSPLYAPPTSWAGVDTGRLKQSRFPAKAVVEISEHATMSIFWWCCSEVEKGHGGTLVPRLGQSGGLLAAVDSGSSFGPETVKRVKKWLQTRSQWGDPETYDITTSSEADSVAASKVD